MIKLFISYKSDDAVKVDKIAHDLALLRHDDGTPIYKTWQDKINLPPASPNWWDAIVEAIIDCDVFVFNLSRASLKSDVCLAELDYAHKRNRPIIIVVLEGEFFLNPISGNYEIGYADLAPKWMLNIQFLFYTGASFFNKFQEAIAEIERKPRRDITAKAPLNPDNNSERQNNHKIYDTACDYAERLAFVDAEKHFSILLTRNDPDYGNEAGEWIELLRLYEELIEIESLPRSHFLFKKKWKAYQALFPKHFLLEDEIFDPKDFSKRDIIEPIKPPEQKKPITKKQLSTKELLKKSDVSHSSKPTSFDLMSDPFAWINIPDKGYSIAKYPTTNAQYSKFIEAGGYTTQEWWTKQGWIALQKGWHSDKYWKPSGIPWDKPLHWRDKRFYGQSYPVIGVSWYEAIAFCLWLSKTTGEKISLPTEQQWQYAAQGNSHRAYPWGNEWQGHLCNHNVAGVGIGKTTAVTQYESKGDSVFDVVDMIGNVWGWCLTDYMTAKNDIDADAKTRVFKGGSWTNTGLRSFRCDSVNRHYPHLRNSKFGFRIVRNNS